MIKEENRIANEEYEKLLASGNIIKQHKPKKHVYSEELDEKETQDTSAKDDEDNIT